MTVTVEEAIATVSRAINGTLQQLFNPDHSRTPHDLFSIFRLPSTARAQRATKATEIYERTLAIIYDHVKQTNILGVNSSIIGMYSRGTRKTTICYMYCIYCICVALY